MRGALVCAGALAFAHSACATVDAPVAQGDEHGGAPSEGGSVAAPAEGGADPVGAGAQAAAPAAAADSAGSGQGGANPVSALDEDTGGAGGAPQLDAGAGTDPAVSGVCHYLCLSEPVVLGEANGIVLVHHPCADTSTDNCTRQCSSNAEACPDELVAFGECVRTMLNPFECNGGVAGEPAPNICPDLRAEFLACLGAAGESPWWQ